MKKVTRARAMQDFRDAQGMLDAFLGHAGPSVKWTASQKEEADELYDFYEKARAGAWEFIETS